MPRLAFMLQVKPDQMEEYKRRHRDVWPELLAALEQSGWRNYSLFLTPDGHLFGYWEADDIHAAMERLDQEPIRQLWRTYMAGLFEDIPEYPGVRRIDLEEVFHLD